MTLGYRRFDPFFVQEHPRGPWHVETQDDPEKMLCGISVSVDASVKVQRRWGVKRCLWCARLLRELGVADD